MQGTTSGVTGALASGVTPSITVAPVAFLSVSPNPIGVGQSALVNMWTTRLLVQCDGNLVTM